MAVQLNAAVAVLPVRLSGFRYVYHCREAARGIGLEGDGDGALRVPIGDLRAGPQREAECGGARSLNAHASRPQPIRVAGG